jgi:hypothetical protein
MAYVSQELKAKIAPKVKAILKKYKVKGSLSVRNHSSLVLTVKEGALDMYKDYGKSEDAAKFGIQVNPYWYKEHFSGKTKAFLSEVIPAMNDGNWDNDYFNVGWYISVNIGEWNKPYQLSK